MTSRRTPHRRQEAGFTLVELMIVVAMVGVLATLALVGYRKYVNSAHIVEPQHMVQSIRVAEEQYRAEMLTYLNVSTSNTYYPQGKPIGGTFDSTRFSFNYPHADHNNWMTLGATADGPVMFGYMANAGAAGDTVSTPIAFSTPPVWPSPTLEPWYIIQAEGNIAGASGGANTHVLGSSFTGEISIENY